jgi:hypothetical protein
MRTIVLALCAACSFTPGRAAQPDSSSGSAARKQLDVVAGGGRVHAGTKTLDVEIGHGVLVRQSIAGTKTISGAPAVKP